MVTALVTVARAELDETVAVSAAAASIGGGGLDLQPGDAMTVRDLLYALLLSSSNEAAAALAEHVAGTQEGFVAAMNGLLRRLDAAGTRFANPHGLDTPGHHSTALDLAKIAAALLERPVLAEIVATPQATIDTPRGPVVEENRNLLLETYDGAIGVKTGRTVGAGHILVAAARRGEDRLIVVAMRSVNAFADAAVLLDFGFALEARLDRPRATTVLTKGTSIGAIVFDPGGTVEVVAAETVRVDLAPGTGSVDYRFAPDAGLQPPLAPGEAIGRVTILAGGRPVGRVRARVADPVPSTDGGWVPTFLGRLMETVAVAVDVVT